AAASLQESCSGKVLLRFAKMPVKGGTKCIKYLLFGFNFIFWLAGTAVLAIGLWLRFDSQTKDIFEHEDNNTTFYTGVYILIGAGALMMLVGFLGCCGAIQESQCMLGLVVDEVKNFYDSVYKKRNEPSAKETLRALQHALNCCGYGGVIEAAFVDTCPKPEVSEILKVQVCAANISGKEKRGKK
ncbi:hypothetical protein JD844_027400, partial [Phrynosoma platyrhinos]